MADTAPREETPEYDTRDDREGSNSAPKDISPETHETHETNEKAEPFHILEQKRPRQPELVKDKEQGHDTTEDQRLNYDDKWEHHQEQNSPPQK